MYHKLSEGHSDFLTSTVSDFEKQICYLLENDYKFYTVSELIQARESKTALNAKAVTITFDDAYINNLTYLLPILQKYNLKACIFIPVAHIGKTNIWDGGNDVLMNVDQLKSGIPYFEFGLHSYFHQDMEKMSGAEFDRDFKLSISTLINSGLPFIKAIAYPYGKFPKGNMNNASRIMTENNISLAFRIGNKINKWPLKNPFLVKRIDIRGTDTFNDFKIKVKKGRVKVF